MTDRVNPHPEDEFDTDLEDWADECYYSYDNPNRITFFNWCEELFD